MVPNSLLESYIDVVNEEKKNSRKICGSKFFEFFRNMLDFQKISAEITKIRAKNFPRVEKISENLFLTF